MFESLTRKVLELMFEMDKDSPAVLAALFDPVVVGFDILALQKRRTGYLSVPLPFAGISLTVFARVASASSIMSCSARSRSRLLL